MYMCMYLHVSHFLSLPSQKRTNTHSIMEDPTYDNLDMHLTEDNIGSETNELVTKKFKPTNDDYNK